MKPPKDKGDSESYPTAMVLPDFDSMDVNVRWKSNNLRNLFSTKRVLSYHTMCHRPDAIPKWQKSGDLIVGGGVWTSGLPYLEIQAFIGPGKLRKRACFSFIPLIRPWAIFPWREAVECEVWYPSKPLHKKWALPWVYRQHPFITSIRYLCRVPDDKHSILAAMPSFNVTLFSTWNNQSVVLPFCVRSSKAVLATACAEPLFAYDGLKKRYPTGMQVCVPI